MAEHLHVLLVTGARPAFRYFETVLGKPYVRLMSTDRWSTALSELRRGQTKLLICEVALSEGPVREFLAQVARATPTSSTGRSRRASSRCPRRSRRSTPR
jgi:hypothetical protein